MEKVEKIEKKIIPIIIILIIVLIVILVIILNKEPEYNKKLYDEIYSEYNEIFEKNKDNKDNKDNYVLEEIEGKNYRVIGKLTIPKMNVKSPILNETTEELLKIAPTKFAGPNPNEVGNLCIIGHNYRNDQFFSNLSTLEIGDEIVLTTNGGDEKKYEVYNKFEVIETDLSATNQETDGKIELTLITCTKNRKYRLIVQCTVK